jgi:transcriptional regulator with XRE-family HTH domain
MRAMQIGDELRALRKSHWLTLANLADATGYSISHLSDLEHDRCAPSWDALCALAAAYGLRVSELVGRLEGIGNKLEGSVTTSVMEIEISHNNDQLLSVRLGNSRIIITKAGVTINET